MSSWNHGYVSEVGYIHGYFREISPAFIEICLLAQRQAHRLGRPLRYLELGYGQGLSINLHAAANVGEFWGADFNPSQAANARELAAASGANVTILDSSFDELARRDDLPEFDMIVLHGVWSWISDADRASVVDIVRRRLAVGGVLYVSYNTLPGWSHLMPIRELMTLHSRFGHDGGNLVNRIDSAITFAGKLAGANALYFRNPGASDWLAKISQHDRRYVAHEYFNANWVPMSVVQVADILEEAKVTYAGTADATLRMESVNLSKEGQELLAGIPHPLFRECVRDYFVNPLFRRDLYVKGPRTLGQLQQSEHLRDMRFALVQDPSDVTFTVTGSLGEGKLLESVYRPIVEAFAAHAAQPISFADLSSLPSLGHLRSDQLAEALFVLISKASLAPAHDAGTVEAVRGACRRFNRCVIERARHMLDGSALASPIVGAGLGASRVSLLFCARAESGTPTADELASYAWSLLEAQGHRLTKDGKPLTTSEENLAEIRLFADEFLRKQLPLYRNLGII